MIRIKKKKRKSLRVEKNKEDLISLANQVNQVVIRNHSKTRLPLTLKMREIKQVTERLKKQILNNSLTSRLLLKR